MTRAIAGVIALGLVIAGCGGSGAGSTSGAPPSSAAAATATDQTPTFTPQEKKNGSLDQVKRRLRAAGFSLLQLDRGPPVVAAVEVSHVDVIGYGNTADATGAEKVIESIFVNHPENGVVKVIGTRVYWTGREKALTAAQRRTFERVIAASEGR